MQNSHIVDCDGHLVEPPDLWERYLDSGLRAKAPRLVIVNGDVRIAMEGRLYLCPRATARAFPACRRPGTDPTMPAGCTRRN